MDRTDYPVNYNDYPVNYNCFEIGYCGHPNFPYTNIQLKQAIGLILSHFQEDYHSFINDTFRKKTQLVSLYYFYKPKKNTSRTDITDYYEKAYNYGPTYGD